MEPQNPAAIWFHRVECPVVRQRLFEPTLQHEDEAGHALREWSERINGDADVSRP